MLPHERLDQALNQKRLDQRKDWNEVAGDLEISSESLRAIRKGRNGPSEKTARKMDDWLNWEPGSVLDLFDGRDPRPRSTSSQVIATPASEKDFPFPPEAPYSPAPGILVMPGPLVQFDVGGGRRVTVAWSGPAPASWEEARRDFLRLVEETANVAPMPVARPNSAGGAPSGDRAVEG